jgi:hypothetical protein
MVQMQQSIPQENAQENLQEKLRSIGERVAALNWTAMNSDLDDYGCATTGPLLTPDQCTILAKSYDSDQLFRSRIIMARHGFGRGEYKYFAYPLPQIVASLRDAFYPALAQVANRWNKALGIVVTYPSTHAAYLRRCHCGRTKQAHAAASPLWSRRLQLPASGHLRRKYLSTSGGISVVGAGTRFYRRRIFTHRATAAHAIAR